MALSDLAFLTTGPGNEGLLKTFKTALVERVEAEAAAFRAGTLITTGTYLAQVPVLRAGATAAWTPEASPIVASAIDVETLPVRLSKVAALTAVSNEAVLSGDVDLVKVHTRSMARDTAMKVDAAFYGDGTVPNAPAGLGSLTGIQEVEPTTVDSIDALVMAAGLMEAAYYQATTIHMNPLTLTRLRQVKETADSGKSLIDMDTASASGEVRRLAGMELIVSPAIEPGVIWVTDKSQTFVLRSTDVRFDTDTSVGFREDVTMIRSTMGVGFAVPNADAVVKVTLPA
ncbi:phage major capsid protein [Dietzia sp. ANT_WB102]|uniref:phage major capsid protein n=1 Tax=Dietzia sp. ANT_WB102 TaxID=2597345 RepID=UPI0011ED7385|nr:phage major capsid protein [Dietzia sp. ANT_WB102]KAA0917004.1 phage major capsid protein [Dietzia sp. ANT_WB102]